MFTAIRNVLVITMLLSLFAACGDEEAVPENEEALTQMILVFSDPDTGDLIAEAIYSDEDGPGEIQGTFEVPSLSPGRRYHVTIKINDGLRNNRDVSADIASKATQYQFFFNQTTPAFSSIAYLDQDANGNPIGLEAEVVTSGSPGTGFMRVTLVKDLDKAAPGVSISNRADSGGEIRIQINYAFQIESGGVGT
jgi:hypothetical protein